MKSLVFDSSSIISLATNNLLWLLRPLKKQFKGDFYISKSIKHEIVDHPMTTEGDVKIREAFYRLSDKIGYKECIYYLKDKIFGSGNYKFTLKDFPKREYDYYRKTGKDIDDKSLLELLNRKYNE